MRTRTLTALVLLAALSLQAHAAKPPTAKPATQPAATDAALLAAHQYADMLHDGKGPDAIKQFWDFDALFDTAFGEPMKKVSAAERDQMRKDMFTIVGAAYADPNVSAQLKAATSGGFHAKELPNHHVSVDFTITLAAGTVLPNNIELAPEGQSWKIVDGGANNHPLAPALRQAYTPVAASQTPPQFVRAMVQAVQAPK
jgi:hypothetical protein